MEARRTQIYLTREQRRRLDEISARQDRSLAELIREAVDEYLDRASADLEATLERTFGAIPDFTVPDRTEWAGRDARLFTDRPAR